MTLGELLERGALGGVLVEQRADGVGDLAAAAVPDRDVDQHPVDVAGGLLGRLELLGGRGGQQVERADRVDPPALLVGERGDRLADDVEQRRELALGAVEVVGREQPQRDDLDADLVAPAEQRLDVGGAGPVAVRGVAADGLGPAPVAVEHHADVLGQPSAGHPAQHPGLVRRVEHPPSPRFQSATRRWYRRSGRSVDVTFIARSVSVTYLLGRFAP